MVSCTEKAEGRVKQPPMLGPLAVAALPYHRPQCPLPGKLFAAMAQADSDRLVQYIFPTERLPAHTQVGRGQIRVRSGVKTKTRDPQAACGRGMVVDH